MDSETHSLLPANGSDDITLRVRKGQLEMKITLSIHSKCEELTRRVREELGDTIRENDNLRLIYMGKLIAPPEEKLTTIRMQPNSIVICVVSPPASQVMAASSALAAPPLIAGNMRGFDRLSDTGMTADEIAAIRTSFRPDVDLFGQRHQRQQDESEVDYRFRLEEEWMTSQGPASEFVLNVSSFLRDRRGGAMNRLRTLFTPSSGGSASTTEIGTTRDFMSGLLLGFFLGFIVLFCFWDANVTHRHRLGLLTGVILSMSLNMDQNNTNNHPKAEPQPHQVEPSPQTPVPDSGDATTTDGRETHVLF